MLIIRFEQVDALRNAARQRFIEAMAAHLRIADPARFDGLHSAATHAFVTRATERAQAAGFNSQRCCNLYLRVLLRLGARRGDELLPPTIAALLAPSPDQAKSDPETSLWEALNAAGPPRPARNGSPFKR